MKVYSDKLKDDLQEHKIANQRANDENKRNMEMQMEEMSKKMKTFKNLLKNGNLVPPQPKSTLSPASNDSNLVIRSLQANAQPLQQVPHAPAAIPAGQPLGTPQQGTITLLQPRP